MLCFYSKKGTADAEVPITKSTSCTLSKHRFLMPKVCMLTGWGELYNIVPLISSKKEAGTQVRL